jgi:hypothetical protein
MRSSCGNSSRSPSATEYRDSRSQCPSVRILGLNAGRQSEDNGFRAPQFVGEALDAHERLYPCQQLFFAHWLDEKVVRSGLNSLDTILHSAEAGDQNDGCEPSLRPVLRRAAHGKAGLVGHDHIDEGKVDGFLLQELQGLLAIRYREHAVAMRAQHHLQHFAGRLVIVGD